MNLLYKIIIITGLLILSDLMQTNSYAETALSGRIVKREGNVVKLNVGYDVGVKLGMVFSVYGIEKHVVLPLSNGKTLISSNELIGEIQITKVENNTAYGKILLEDGQQKINSLCYVHEYEELPVPNQPPIIRSIKINPVNPIQPGKVLKVEVDAVDTNSDPLIYSWETDSGYFLSENTLVPVNYCLTSFDKGDFTITVDVKDQRGGHDREKSIITAIKPDCNDDLGDYSPIRTLKKDLSFSHSFHVTDVSFDSKNNMYLLDTDGNCVRVFDSNGRYLRALCSSKLISPDELQINDDKIYIIDDRNKLLKRYDLSGELEVNYSKTKMMRRGIGNVIKPISLDVSEEGDLYVIDGEDRNIAVFEKDGRFRLRFGISGTKDGQLIDPIAIKIDSGGYIYVLDSDKQEIIVYSPGMQYDRSIKLKKGEYKDMFLDKYKEQLYLVNALNEKIYIIDYQGKAIEVFGGMKAPFRITMDKLSNVYVTNNSEGYVSKFITNGNYSYYGKFGTNPFVDVIDIAVDKSGSLFLLKEKSFEIIKVDKDGWELARFGARGYGDREFRKAVAIVTGKGGEYVYVLDTTKGEVSKFSNSGKFIEIVVSKKDDRINKIIDIDSDSEGNIYVLDSKIDVCFVYSQDGRFLTQIGNRGKRKDLKKKDFKLLYKPIRIAVNPDGESVYVFDNNTKLRKINKYVKENSRYNFLRYFEYSKKISRIKANNYNRLMVIDTNPHVISFIGENGITERTFSGKNSFINARDIEVNGVENVYVIGEESKVFVLKQEKLRHE
jgi:DNA-binding beta-propeller fold protein YncE